MAPPSINQFGLGLDDLIRFVRDTHPGGGELERLSTAVMVAQNLDDLGDHLIGHFVDQARRAGASWTAIGSSMGVTKQAAQKRFVPGTGDVEQGQLFSRFTPRARAVVEGAHDGAKGMKNAQVGTEHLVVALAKGDGVAAQALKAQEVTLKQLIAKVAELAQPPVDEVPDRIPFGPQAKKALELALREALRRQHNYIGTEHLLLGVLADDTPGSRILLELGVTAEATADHIDQALAAAMAKLSSD